MIKTDAVIVGAGPVGLFAVFELGIMGLNAHVIDNLDKVGGQCIELYPDKPIYDIPALPECTGESLTKNLLKQIDPFKTNFHLNQRVEKLEKKDNAWIVTTSDQNQFETPNIIIAAGVGSFEP
ncbi:MAG: NAD(P)/FAD-dependent oxidoreductase, partial [Pelagibacteraceae bacterium]